VADELRSAKVALQKRKEGSLMPTSAQRLALSMTKSGSSVQVNVSSNSPRFLWIKAIRVSLRGGGQQQAWTFREGDSQQGFWGGRNGLLDPGSGSALFVEIPNVAWASQGEAEAAFVELSSLKSNTFKSN
jgi:hypothetical protein